MPATATTRPRGRTAAPAAMTPERFRHLLKACGHTRAMVADLCGVNRRTILRWATGDTPIDRAGKLLIESVLLPIRRA